MVEEIKTIEERKNKLLTIGKKQGFVTYEQLADQLKGLDVDSDTLDELYNFLVENNIEIVSEDGTDDCPWDGCWRERCDVPPPGRRC